MLLVWGVTGSWEKDTARLMRNGWQKLKPIRHRRGGTTAKMGHLSLVRVAVKRECGPVRVTRCSETIRSVYSMGRSRATTYACPMRTRGDGANSRFEDACPNGKDRLQSETWNIPL